MPQLCIHYDAGIISLQKVRELAHSVGAEITGHVGHLILRSAETLHARAASGLGAKIRALDGVLEAEVTGSGVVRVEFDRELISEAALRGKMAASGIFLAEKPTEELAHVEDHEQAPAAKGAGPRRMKRTRMYTRACSAKSPSSRLH